MRLAFANHCVHILHDTGLFGSGPRQTRQPQGESWRARWGNGSIAALVLRDKTRRQHERSPVKAYAACAIGTLAASRARSCGSEKSSAGTSGTMPFGLTRSLL